MRERGQGKNGSKRLLKGAQREAVLPPPLTIILAHALILNKSLQQQEREDITYRGICMCICTYVYVYMHMLSLGSKKLKHFREEERCRERKDARKARDLDVTLTASQ